MNEVTVGLEIHQQLDTGKLFCPCRSNLVEEKGREILRKLRPSQSELGEVDRAALAEAEKNLRFRYQAPPGVSCLVEADEEPPHAANEEAIDVVLTVSAMLNARPVDEIHFMRKIVIDGSNTTGFQRTGLVAMHGYLEVNGRRISIPTICLEEDAARKVEAGRGEVVYRLDRLGIPLIEIATGPEMHSPEEVREVAQTLGSIMRATKRVKRGIGTIREDINISIPGGARVEIKGVQELNMLPLYVEKEMERQRSLLRIRDILREREVRKVDVTIEDVTSIFEGSGSKVISSGLSKGGKVFALKLPGFAGVLKSEDGTFRLGAEMAQRARTRGVKGIFHSDELPGYGIGDEEVRKVREVLGLAHSDAFVLCVERKEKAEAALNAVAERANEALIGVPEETRDPQPDGSTVYSRPLPGAERMYPETDVPPVTVKEERWKRILENLPEMPSETVERLAAQYGIHRQVASQLVKEGMDDLFEMICSDHPSMATIVAGTLTGTFTELEREGLPVSEIGEELIVQVFGQLEKKRFAKEALPDIFRRLCKVRDLEKVLEELGLKLLTDGEAKSIIAGIVEERIDFVRKKGLGATGPLMGVVMERLRGRIDGKKASELLRAEIERVLGS